MESLQEWFLKHQNQTSRSADVAIGLFHASNVVLTVQTENKPQPVNGREEGPVVVLVDIVDLVVFVFVRLLHDRLNRLRGGALWREEGGKGGKRMR